LDATAMAALCTIIAYPARCEKIADSFDLTSRSLPTAMSGSGSSGMNPA
jgi:hypothetical protein